VFVYSYLIYGFSERSIFTLPAVAVRLWFEGEKLEQQAVIKTFSGLRPTGVGVKSRSLTGLSIVSTS
jgi:hypothetical protein